MARLKAFTSLLFTLVGRSGRLYSKLQSFSIHNKNYPIIIDTKIFKLVLYSSNIHFQSYGFHPSGTQLHSMVKLSMDHRGPPHHSSKRNPIHLGHGHYRTLEGAPVIAHRSVSYSTSFLDTRHKAALLYSRGPPGCSHDTWKNSDISRTHDQIAGSWCSCVCIAGQTLFCLFHKSHNLCQCTWCYWLWCHTAVRSHDSVPPPFELRAFAGKHSISAPAACCWWRRWSSQGDRTLCPMPVGTFCWWLRILLNQLQPQQALEKGIQKPSWGEYSRKSLIRTHWDQKVFR